MPRRWPRPPSAAACRPFTATITGARRCWAPLPTTCRFAIIEIDKGQPFTTSDVEAASKVALLGKTVIDNLFNGENPVGQIIRIKTVPFTVIGTLVPKGQSPTGQDQDDVILMPISTAKKKVIGTSQANYAAVGSIFVQAREGRSDGRAGRR